MKSHLTRLALAAAIIASVLAPATAFAGVGEELTIAQTHALLAYRSGGGRRGGSAAVKMHFQHVLNCLVGPGGAGYDVTPPMMDPCASSGKGAINDAANADQKARVQVAIDKVKQDLAITDDTKLQDAATELADAVGAAK